MFECARERWVWLSTMQVIEYDSSPWVRFCLNSVPSFNLGYFFSKVIFEPTILTNAACFFHIFCDWTVRILEENVRSRVRRTIKPSQQNEHATHKYQSPTWKGSDAYISRWISNPKNHPLRWIPHLWQGHIEKRSYLWHQCLSENHDPGHTQRIAILQVPRFRCNPLDLQRSK